ncbi:hypothetical protein MUP59_04565, partial [Candidatus Bathyarchaeota archaeon]|nr:hypothetical protein [Candidatus Bathyarchaeota archaeon]
NQALYLCMFMSGLGTGEIVYWSNHGAENLREQLSNDARMIRIDIPGRKGDRNERNFYSFIAGDALDYLRKWWKIRPRDAKVIFVNERHTPVTESGVYAIWLRHMRRLGIIDPKKEGQREYSNRTGRGLHELRDIFRMQFGKSPAKPEIAEFMMGHIVDPLGYNQVGKDERFCQDEYRKALPYLNLLSSGTPFYQVPKDELDALNERNERLEKEIEENKMDVQRLMGLLMRVTERLVPAANGAAQLIKKGDKAAEQALNNGLDDVANGDKDIRKTLDDLKNDFLSRSTFRKKHIKDIVKGAR